MNLFQIERRDALGGDLVAPIMDAYWEGIPQDRREEVLRLLAVIETEGIKREVFTSYHLRCTPGWAENQAAVEGVVLA